MGKSLVITILLVTSITVLNLENAHAQAGADRMEEAVELDVPNITKPDKIDPKESTETEKLEISIVGDTIEPSPLGGSPADFESENELTSTTKPSEAGRFPGCLIATATFGSELAPQVQLLREIRDNVVLSTSSGTTFMAGFNEFYYTFSPTVSDWERQSPAFKELVKISLTPMLSTLSILNYANIDSETEMLGYGIGVILLNLGMYVVAPTIFIIKIRSKFRL